MRRLLACVAAVLVACPAIGLAPAVLYVDPCTPYDDRVQRTRDACEAYGARLVTVWSEPFADMLSARGGSPEELAAIRADRAPSSGDELIWASSAIGDGSALLGVCCGSDAGLATAERLAHVLAPERSNGLLRARRDKYEMHEALRAVGLAAARQTVASEWSEASEFAEELFGGAEATALVVKPRRGQSSVRVGLARSEEEARSAFEAVLELPASLDPDASASSALLQECNRHL